MFGYDYLPKDRWATVGIPGLDQLGFMNWNQVGPMTSDPRESLRFNVEYRGKHSIRVGGIDTHVYVIRTKRDNRAAAIVKIDERAGFRLYVSYSFATHTPWVEGMDGGDITGAESVRAALDYQRWLKNQ